MISNTDSRSKPILEFLNMKTTMFLGKYNNINIRKFNKNFNKLVLNQDMRKDMSIKGKKFLDTNGSKRIISKLIKYKFFEK